MAHSKAGQYGSYPIGPTKPPLAAPNLLCQKYTELVGLKTFKGPIITLRHADAYYDLMQDVIFGLEEWILLGTDMLPRHVLEFHIAHSDVLLNYMQFALCQVQLDASVQLSPQQSKHLWECNYAIY